MAAGVFHACGLFDWAQASTLIFHDKAYSEGKDADGEIILLE
jgi:hypothetical protein